MDDCIQEAMLRCMQVSSIITIGPIVTEEQKITPRMLTRFSFNLT